MNWNPMDIHSLKFGNVGSNVENIKKITEINIQHLETRKKKWNDQIKDFPSPYQYLKDNIHN